MTWKLRYNDSNTWSGWQSIDAPNNEIVITHTTTRMIHDLYTGAKGRTIPNTKYNFEPVKLDWNFISGGSALLYNGASGGGAGLSLLSIMSGGYKIEIQTHELSGTSSEEIWQGYIIEYPKAYKLGMFRSNGASYSEFYDVSTTIDLISIT